jgi:hypothetical protein
MRSTTPSPLVSSPRFTRPYTAILTAIFERGVRGAFADLDHYADD